MGIQDSLYRIVVAEEPEIEIKGDKKVEKMHNLFPGYVFVEMKMTDEAWYVVRNTPGVTGFIGSSGGGAKPFPVAPDEMESILKRMGQSDKKIVVDFKIGDTVKILTGPFVGMEGRVSTMNDQTQTANVLCMKNKMQLLITLIADPGIMLLDEPLTSFDVVVADEMKQLLRREKEDHIIILSTHIMELALDLCDRIVILNDGVLEEIQKESLDDHG